MKMEVKDLIAAPFTPFTKDGSINFDIIEEYATCLRNQGVFNVYLNGTTGEGKILKQKRHSENYSFISTLPLKMIFNKAKIFLKNYRRK